MTPQESPQPLLLRRKREALRAAPEPARSDSDDDVPYEMYYGLQSTGTPEPQRADSPNPVSLPPSPAPEPETADDSWLGENDDAELVDVEELQRTEAWKAHVSSAARELAAITSVCAAIVAAADKVLRQPIQAASKLVHGTQKRIRGTDLFYLLLRKRVVELGFCCPPVSDPMVQKLCSTRALSRGLEPAQAIEYLLKFLRKEKRKTMRHAQRSVQGPATGHHGDAATGRMPPNNPPGGGAVQPPPQPLRISAHALFRSIGLKPGVELTAAYRECEGLLAATGIARGRACEQAFRGGAVAGAANAVARAADATSWS